MPFTSGQSSSPRVTKDSLHPYSMNAADAFGVIIKGQPGPRYFNYQGQLCVTPKGTWLACWTQGSYESNPDQRMVVARSIDQGITWSKEIAIESSAGRYQVPAWIVSYLVPHTGRIYLFYWYNFNGVPLRDAGDIFFRYSDDDGINWSDRYCVGVPRTSMDREEPGDIHGWNFGQPRLMPTGQVLMTYTKMKRSSIYPQGWWLDTDNCWQPKPGTDPATRPANEYGGDANNWYTEVYFLEMSNILTETDPLKMIFRFLPVGDEGLWVNYQGTDRHFGQEGTLAGLSGGRLLCVLRSRLGHPFFSISADKGNTWSTPEVLRMCPGGEPFNQPCAPCPITKLPDGRFIFLFHNVKPEGSGWTPRDPLWITVGREATGVKENAGLYFTKPKVIIYNDGVPDGPFNDCEISYPSFYAIAGKYYVTYANKTCQLCINEIPDDLLDDAGLPVS